MDLVRNYLELEPIPYVQQKKKYQTFHIVELGGTKELDVWKREQEKKAFEYSLLHKARKKKAADLIAGDDSPSGDGVTWTGKASSTGLNECEWESKRLYALDRMKSFNRKPDDLIEVRNYPIIEEEKQTIFMRIKSFMHKLWLDANF